MTSCCFFARRLLYVRRLNYQSRSISTTREQRTRMNNHKWPSFPDPEYRGQLVDSGIRNDAAGAFGLRPLLPLQMRISNLHT